MYVSEKALALVVRGTDWSETSRVTTLFTREFGKVRALAKGGRRLKSNFEIAFDLLSVCQVVFIRKSSGGLDLLTEAQMAERFPILRQNLSALYAGYYVAELLADGTQDYDPHPPLFDFALETLRSLGAIQLETTGEAASQIPQPFQVSGEVIDKRGASSSRGVVAAAVLDCVTRFELAWLRELGYSPRLDACAGCGGAVLAPGVVRVLLSPALGGVLCPACGPGASDRRPLSVAAFEVLRKISALDREVWSGAPTVSIRGELRQVLGQLVSYVLGRRPRLLAYLDGHASG